MTTLDMKVVIEPSLSHHPGVLSDEDVAASGFF
jgi:hypothetical protein